MAPTQGAQSPNYIDFYKAVAKKAGDITNACIEDKGFWACFDKTAESDMKFALQKSTCMPMTRLRSALTVLEETLNHLYRKSPNDPVFIVVFDKVSSLIVGLYWKLKYHFAIAIVGEELEFTTLC
jgi:hypothetical protein